MSPPAPHLVDEILEEIFFCLPTPAALARASTAYPRFRRIITDRSFLRRYRRRHPPPLLGFADKNGFHPAQAPHPSAPLARALAAAADFTFSFVPKPGEFSWIPCDVRDGRVLLESSGYGLLRELAVCDPLSRRYVLFPPIPEDLAAQQEEEKLVEIASLLAPIGEDEDETSFRVICPARYKSKLVAFLFSSVTGNWCVAASRSWSSLGTVEPKDALLYFNHIHDWFYWTELWRDKLLVLDTRTMAFSTMNQPGQNIFESYIVAGRGEEALEILSVVHDRKTKVPFAVHHNIQRINDDTSMEWWLEKIIPLSHHLHCFTSGAAEGMLFFGATTYGLSTDFEEHYFSLDAQTYETTEVCRKMGFRTLFDDANPCWYFGFPPSLSKPSI